MYILLYCGFCFLCQRGIDTEETQYFKISDAFVIYCVFQERVISLLRPFHDFKTDFFPCDNLSFD